MNSQLGTNHSNDDALFDIAPHASTGTQMDYSMDAVTVSETLPVIMLNHDGKAFNSWPSVTRSFRDHWQTNSPHDH